MLVCFPVIRPFPHRPINRTPLRTGTSQPHSFSVPQVSSWLQVVSKLHASYINRSVIQGGSFLSYLTRFLSLYLFPLFFRLPLFFSNPPYPPIIFLPPYGQGSILSPIPPILYIIYILLLYILSPSTKILFIPISLLSSLILFRSRCEDRIVYPFISLHFLLPSFSVLFDVRIDRYFYVLLLSSPFFLFGSLFSGMRIIRIYIHSSIHPILFVSFRCRYEEV